MKNSYNEEINHVIKKIIEEKNLLNIKLVVLNNLTAELFDNYDYDNTLSIEDDTNIKILGFIEIINPTNDKNTLLFFNENYDKYFCDAYNRSVFNSNKSKFFNFEYIRKGNNKKYIIYTFNIYKHQSGFNNYLKFINIFIKKIFF